MTSDEAHDRLFSYRAETKKTKTLPGDIKIEKGTQANLLDAATEGAITAVYLVSRLLLIASQMN